MMKNGQVRENPGEQLLNLDLSATEKLKVLRGVQSSALLGTVRDGIVHFVNEARGKRDSSKSIDKLNETGVAPLHKATQNDQTDSAKSLLDEGADIDVRTREDKLTPLHIAARFNCVETAKLLIQRGANPALVSTNGSTALHFAAHRGNDQVAELLVHLANIDIDSKDSAHMTPLHLACVSGNTAISRMLLDRGADIRAKSTELMTPLHTALFNGNSEVAAMILRAAIEAKKENAELFDDRDVGCNTVLHLSAGTNDLKTAQACLANGADINAVNSNKETPLYVATVKGNLQMVELLVQTGADVNVKNADSKSVLHKAALFDRDDIISFLLDHGVPIDTRDAQNSTPFLDAVAAGQTKCARLLLQRGANIKASDIQMKNCIHMAVENEYLETLRMLLKESSVFRNLYRPDFRERVPLHYAAMAKDVRIMNALLDKQTRFTFHDEAKQTPLHLAAHYGRHEQVDVLARRVASGLNERDEQGRTPLHNAVMNGHRKTCSILLKLSADACSKDNNHWTPLMWASKLSRVKACQELLNVKVPVDDVNMDGDTALHIACRQDHVTIVNLLLTNGASLNACNRQSLTCLETAAQAGNSEVALALVTHPRWPEIMEHKDVHGHTPMKLLIEHFPESAELLMDRCIKRSEMTSSNDPQFTVTYDFRLLDPGPDDPAFLIGRRFFGPSTMVKNERKQLLLHPLTQVLLNQKWSTFGRFVHYFNFLSYLVFVTLFSAFIVIEREKFAFGRHRPFSHYEGETYQPNGMSYIVFSFTVVHLLKEILQMSIERFKYFMEISNVMEWVLYGTAFAFMIPFVMPDDVTNDQFEAMIHPDRRWILGVTSIFLCYANLVLFLRRFRLFGIYVTMFLEVTQTLFKTLLVFSVCLVGFSIVFFVLFKEQLAFQNPGRALIMVLVMTVGEIGFEETFIDTIGKNSTSTNNPLNPFPEASFVFISFFLLLMTIILMNLLVGLAVGDIDAIRQNATLKRLAMQVEFVAEVEDRYPRVITRRVYQPTLTCRPNCPTRWWRLIGLLGMKDFFALNSGLPTEEEQSSLSEYAEIKKQLVKTKRRVKRLVNVLEAQNTMLRRLARKIDPEAEMDEGNLGATMMNEQKALAQDFLYDPRDDQLPIEASMDRPYKTYV